MKALLKSVFLAIKERCTADSPDDEEQLEIVESEIDDLNADLTFAEDEMTRRSIIASLVMCSHRRQDILDIIHEKSIRHNKGACR